MTVGAVTAIAVTTAVGYQALSHSPRPLGAGMALADALQPAGRAVAVLEQQRQHLIVMTADVKSIQLVGSPALASSGSPAGSSGAGGAAGSSGAGPNPGGLPANPTSAQQIAIAMLPSFGFASSQFGCLNDLWTQESGWRYNAENASGAYGIPQALPGDKMASAGADWATDPTTQIKWGLGYIKSYYETPCGAWAHEESSGWY